jgi:hypothetical protein
MPIKKYVQEIHESSRKPIKTTSLKPGGKPRYFYKTMFSGILPLISKICINVIPSPGFKLVVLIGFRDDSWIS